MKMRIDFSFIFQLMLECFCCCETIKSLCSSSAKVGQTLLRWPSLRRRRGQVGVVFLEK
ncbi:hypothetical protein CLU79DRAFT_867462 [Phycomyces nitens]|nr:hypothetical protein CLU79DRAFT_867462 [Phycomyces nitens]